MKNIIKRDIVLLLLVLVQNVFCDKYLHFDRFTVEEGLSSNLVNDIDQDSCGHLWIATDFGVSRYDGHSFKRYVNEETPSLLRNDMEHVQAFPDGSVFLGAQLGVMLKYDSQNDTFIDVSPDEFNRSYYKSVEGFTLSRKGTPLSYTSGGFYQYNDDSVRFDDRLNLFEKWKNHYVVSLYEDMKGRYWVGSFNSLKIVSPEGDLLKQVDLSQEDAKPMFAAKITAVDDRHILVSFFSDVIYSFELDGEGEIAGPTLVKLPFSNLNHILCDKKGHFWYTTDGDGLWYSEGYPCKTEIFQQVVPTDGRSRDLEKLYSIKESRNGDIWIGTHSSGLWRCRPNQTQAFVPSSDLLFQMQMASSFSEDERGNLYVTCDGGGLAKIAADYSSVEYFGEKNGLTSCNVVCHAQDRSGHLWLATWGGGLVEFDPKNQRFRQETFPDLHKHLSCFSYVTATSDGELWVSTGGDGMFVRDKQGKWRQLLLKFEENEYDMWPFKTVEGNDGSRWIATSRSLWRVKGDEQHPLMGDFSKSKDHNPMHVNDVFARKDGKVFVATNRFLLCYSQDGKVCDTLDFLPKTTFSSLNCDKEGRLLVSSGEGILKIDDAERTYMRCAYDFSKGGKNFFRAHSSYLTRRGDLLWGTKNGFVIQNGMESVQSVFVEHFQITDVRSGDLSLAEMKSYVEWNDEGSIASVEMPYGMSNLKIAVDMVNYSDLQIKLLYRLTGFEEKWQEVPDSRIIEFSYLPSGTYQLDVKASLPSEEKTVSVKIVIHAPWWQQWWFVLLTVLSSLGIILAFFYVRMRRVEAQKHLLEQMVEERTKELDEKNLKIEEQNDELRHVLSDKDRVLSVLAHDLKNPMFAIVGALEGWLRLEPTLENSEKRTIITEVLDSSQTLQTEMGRLLEWARSESGKIDFNPADVDVKSSLSNVSSLHSSLISKKNIRFHVEGDLVHCAWADSRMVSTVFRNFINNAVKFTPEDGEISVRLNEEDEYIRIVIQDTGVGMTAIQLEALKTQGYTQSTLGTDNEKGTGLGFRICRDYVERNKGYLEVDSEEGKGTTIMLLLPKSQKMVDNQTTVIKEKARLAESVDRTMLEGNSVLVVDDDALICQNVASILQEYMDVQTAANGAEALQIMQEKQVDLVLSDVEMPVMNGIEFSRALAADEQTNTTPVLFLSAKNEESDRLLGLLSGAVDYIAKPFSASELLMKVNNILRLRQMQQIRLMQQHYFSLEKEAEEEKEPQEQENPKKMNPFVERVMTFISEHYSESDLTIERLASAVNVSQSTLTRKLKSMVNKTPVELLNEYRMNKALQLLKNEDREENIAEIAYEVGYSDPAYFTRKFKDFYGYLPSSVKG